MKQPSYRERDHHFGQAMLALRDAMGVTQAELAELLGISRYAIGDWELGNKYPKADHLKNLITLAVQQNAFPAGHEEEEIRALWKLAHQKVLLDERWLAALLPDARPIQTETRAASPIASTQRRDWGAALRVPSFYGREVELSLLTTWVVEERCRVVSVVGFGGIGKSTLVVQLMHQLADQFENVIWRSLRDVPTYEALLDDCLRVLGSKPLEALPVNLDDRQNLLLKYIRSTRTLLVLDNLESILEEGKSAGRLRDDYQNLGRVLYLTAETDHQSCIFLTSREKLSELVSQEGGRSPVRTLRLTQLDSDSCEELLAEKEVTGSESDRANLIRAYEGNPLALKIVAQTIVELFHGEIMPFLEQGEVIFGGVRRLLNEHFTRLSRLEQDVMIWLAILREPSTLAELRTVLIQPTASAGLLEAIESLSRRSLIERGQERGTFTLQSVVLEYVTARLITAVSDELETGQLDRFVKYGLELAHTREYVRQIQIRLIATPVLDRLRSIYSTQPRLEERLIELLKGMSGQDEAVQGYGPSNLIVLLRLLRGNLRGLDLSQLVLRNLNLQGVAMQDTTVSNALMRDIFFTQTFSAVLAVDVSKSGDYWAASTIHGDVMVWTGTGLTLHRAWRAHSDMIWALKFSRDGRFLATGSWDCAVKVWDCAIGTLLWSGRHGSHVNGVAFSPDGRLLASGSSDATVALWDVERGTQLQTLSHPIGVSGCALDWSPDGSLLISGDREGIIRLWELSEIGATQCLQTLTGHSTFVDVLAFSPDGLLIASASFDGTVKLWEMVSSQLHLRQTLVGHIARIGRVAWSPDGRTLACGGMDTMVWLFDLEEGSYPAALRGHTSGVTGLAYTPDGASLLSGGDYSLRLWDVVTGHCTRVNEGYSNFLYAVDWSPDGTHLVSGGMDMLVTVWKLSDDTPSQVLRGHSGAVRGVGWSSNGRWVASSEWDNMIRLWDPISGTCSQILEHPDASASFFGGVAWSPDGERLACGSHQHGVHVFEMTAQQPRWARALFPTSTLPVTWSPDGAQLAGGGGDGAVYVWDAGEAMQFRRLAGHHSTITDLAWSPGGMHLASVSRGRVGSELFIWDIPHEKLVQTLTPLSGIVNAVTWSSNEAIVISGDSDGMLSWWDVQSGKCLLSRQAHQGTVRALRQSPDSTKLASCGDDGVIMLWDLSSGEHLQTLRRDRPYERLNITGIRGLTEAQKEMLYSLGAIEDSVV
jgi:WD40 repeat protein/transcriptional regulator with XRE-family HTH domain